MQAAQVALPSPALASLDMLAAMAVRETLRTPRVSMNIPDAAAGLADLAAAGAMQAQVLILTQGITSLVFIPHIASQEA